MITYPLNNIDYTAEDAELYFSTRESGVYDGNDFEVTASGIDNDVIVGSGIAWIHNTKFSGKVAALKEPKTLTLSLPDSVYDRIDAIVVQFDANKNATEIVVKEGIASSTPVAPNVVRTESLYELHIFHVQRKAGAAVIGVDDLIDLRNDSDYCGIMFDSISSIDSTLNKRGYAADAKATGDGIKAAKAAAESALTESVSKSGDTMTGYLDFDQTSQGLSWTTDDGTIIRLRPYSPSNVFQMTMQNPTKGIGEFGAFNIGTSGDFTVHKPYQFREHIEASHKKLLWSNASPTSNFGSQTLAVNFGEYQQIEIEFGTAHSTGAFNRFCMTCANVPAANTAGMLSMDSSSAVFRQRAFNFNSTTSIAFQEGKISVGGGGAYTDNSVCIPLNIYGIKY